MHWRSRNQSSFNGNRAMTPLFRSLAWKSSTVSWLSFFIMGLVVAGIGLSGTAHVVNYLQERLTVHGIEHNREIASALLPKLESFFLSDSQDVKSILSHAIDDYRAFGFRIYVLDRNNQTIIVDSEMSLDSPLSIEQSWLAHATRLDGSKTLLSQESGALHALDNEQHPMLIWQQGMTMQETGRWYLGVGKDQKALNDFMGELHWHLDAVMLLTYVLITLLGYYAMRLIGRIYERRLESQVRDRTQALETAHKEVLLKTRLATIGQTASVLTHEMRNPLASIKLALSGLRGSASLEDREHRRVDLVLGEVDRLDGLLSETLDYVRPVRLSAKPVDMDRLLSKVLKQQEPLWEEKGILLKHAGCSDCTAMRVDETQIHQVLLNLIKNAIEASPQGGEMGASLRHEGDELVFEITNGGEPLSEEVLGRAFEPFFTTKPKGTGLGLGLVKRVVEEHGGTVTLASNAGIGTRLTLTFPFRTALHPPGISFVRAD